MRSNLVDIDARLVWETDKARLFDFGKDEQGTWLPKSQHEWDPDTKQVTMEESYAIDKGLV